MLLVQKAMQLPKLTLLYAVRITLVSYFCIHAVAVMLLLLAHMLWSFRSSIKCQHSYRQHWLCLTLFTMFMVMIMVMPYTVTMFTLPPHICHAKCKLIPAFVSVL